MGEVARIDVAHLTDSLPGMVLTVFRNRRGLPGHDLPLSVAPDKRSGVSERMRRGVRILGMHYQFEIHHGRFTVLMDREVFAGKRRIRSRNRRTAGVGENVLLRDYLAAVARVDHIVGKEAIERGPFVCRNVLQEVLDECDQLLPGRRFLRRVLTDLNVSIDP